MTEPEAAVSAELLERVKGATGPDRELDIALWDYCMGWPVVNGRPDWRVTPNGGAASAELFAPHYTTSADASLALLEYMLPEWAWNVGNVGQDNTPAASVTMPRDDFRDFVVSAATPALAILAAMLTALTALKSAEKTP